MVDQHAEQRRRRHGAASTRAAVISEPSSEQISATVTGLGGGGTSAGTVNGPSHAPASSDSVKSPASGSGLPAAKDVNRCA
jgi:hypothetical protein